MVCWRVICESVSEPSGAGSGTLPLLYQWQLNGTNLSDGGPMSGSEGNTLGIIEP
jgi:hypothetical protein